MHVHLDQAAEAAGPLLVSYGVTSVRDVGSPFRNVSCWTERSAASALVAPRIHATGLMFESPRFMELVDRFGRMLPASEATLLSNLMRRRIVVNDVENIERELNAAKAHGATFAIVRNVQTPELLYAFAAIGRRVGLPLAAHVITGVDLARASESGVHSFEHYQGYPDVDVDAAAAQNAALVRAFEQHVTALVPTLVTRDSQKVSPDAAMRVLNDSRQLAALRAAGVSREVLALWRMKVDLIRLDPPPDWSRTWNVGVKFLRFAHRNGVEILAGMDLGIPFVHPGRSLIDELQLLVQDVGLTPAEALTSATVAAARWFGLDGHMGTIATGKLADMVLLGSNPLIAIGNLHDVRGVVIRGRYYSRSELQSSVASVR
jgi:imidazolonepropionase-like amidohydrolase